MMYGYGSYGSSGLLAFGMHVHMLFALLLLFGFVAGLTWLFRFAKEAQVKKMVWISLLLGAFGVLLTAPMAYWGMQNMMQGWYENTVTDDDDRNWGMMDWYFDREEDSTTTDQTTTDANGS